MPETFTYEPNSLTGVLSRIETNLKTCTENLGSLRDEFKEAHKSLHSRLDTHENDLVVLKSSEKARDDQVKRALVIGGVIIAAGQLVLEWVRRSS